MIVKPLRESSWVFATVQQGDPTNEETSRACGRSWEELPPLDEMIVLELAMQKSGLPSSSHRFREEPPTPPHLAELIDWHGVSLWFDCETGFFPNEHHYLLYEIAARARGALQGVHFVEIAPSLEGDSRSEPYKLQAYADGKRFEVQAQNYSDWYDVGAVVGLANRLLRHRKSEIRVVVWDGSDQAVGLLVAPEQSILEAHAKGWIRVEGIQN